MANTSVLHYVFNFFITGMKVRFKFLQNLVVIALCFGTFVLPTTSFAYEASNAYDCGKGGDFPMTFGGCRAGYYYEDWENADTSLTPDKIGECLECPDGYACYGGFAGPVSGASCQVGYYGSGANCTPCTNKPANSTYTGAAATNSCSWTCDSGYTKVGTSCIIPYEYDAGGNMYNCNVGHFPMAFAGCRAGYYYEDWENADASLLPDEIGECLECPDGYTCAGGFAGPEVPSPCAAGYYGTTIESCSACTNKPAHSTYTGPAATNSCPWECDSGYNENNGTCSVCTADQITINGTCQTAKFTITTTNNTDEFGFYLSAAGTFYIDWGDGTVETINRTNDTSYTKYEHQYASAKKYTVRFGGAATDYNTDEVMPTITFNEEDAGYGDRSDNWAQNIASITGDLGKIFGAVQSGNMPKFNSTFATAQITSIPSGLFASIDTSNATNTSYMFYQTFLGCSNLTAIPNGLFASIDTSNATSTHGMFVDTFWGCSNLTAIPNGLFASIDTSSATDTSNMFQSTFSGCSNLTAIPDGLFDSINTSKSTNTGSMFFNTFYNCSNLTAIPDGLFVSIDTSNATNTSGMFNSTFYNCTNLTTIPNGLFASIDTSNATNTSSMFSYTFYGCSNLTGFIPPSAFAGLIAIGSPTASGMWTNTFAGTRLAKTCPSGMTEYNTGYKNAWGGYVSCEIDYPFTLTTTSTNSFQFKLSAVGNFYVDCGNGGTLSGSGVSGQTITRSGTNEATYTCAWGTSTAQTIRFGGTATDYNTNTTTAAISFYTDQTNANKVASISGDLGKIFGRVQSNRIPRFYRTFYGCSNLTTIPNGLFASIDTSNATNTSGMFIGTFSSCSNLTAIPAGLFDSIDTSKSTNTSQMFTYTFYNCSGLTGAIPTGLFASIDTSNATNTSYMFQETFKDCSNLTAIPSGLFNSIDTSNATNTASMFNSTFYNCTNLTTIPNGLFASIDTSKSTNTGGMFQETFKDCSNLTTIPNGLFDSIDTSSATSTSSMFNDAFNRCSKLTAIPNGLFASIDTSSATYTNYMFNGTFYGCSGLTAIPDGLFASIDTSSATNTSYMFQNTFYNCTNLTTIPNGLFNSVDTSKSTDTSGMFSYTFFGCSNLTAIPNGLFDSIDTSNATDTSGMFSYTFYDCRNLTAIPKTLFNPNISMAKTTSYNDMFKQMFNGCSNLTGYIPSTTFPVGLNVAKSTFTYAFSGTQLATTCPAETELYDTYDGKVACTLLNVDCTAGYYLPANVNECAICPINSVCVGGNYPLSETIDQGIQSCANGTFAPSGSAVCYPHILHVGDSNVYLKSTKQTTPSLNIKIGNDVFYANMTTERTSMNKDSSHYLHVKTADNVHYYVCDDTTCPQ